MDFDIEYKKNNFIIGLCCIIWSLSNYFFNKYFLNIIRNNLLKNYSLYDASVKFNSINNTYMKYVNVILFTLILILVIISIIKCKKNNIKIFKIDIFSNGYLLVLISFVLFLFGITFWSSLFMFVASIIFFRRK